MKSIALAGVLLSVASTIAGLALPGSPSSRTPTFEPAFIQIEPRAPVPVAAASPSLPYSGIATFMYQQGMAGACGAVHQDTDFVVAINTPMWDNGAHCGQTVEVRNSKTGTTVTVKVADQCPTCSSGSLDLSEGAFQALTGALFPELVDITWGYV